MRVAAKKKAVRKESLVSRIIRLHKKKFFDPVLKKKKKSKSLEDKLKEKKKKSKEISDAIEKESKKKLKRTLDPIYGRFKGFLDAEYGPHDAAAEEMYGPKVDYEKLFSYLGSGVKVEYDGEEFVQEGFVQKKGEMGHLEAEDTIQKIQYSLMLKSLDKVDVRQKERFAYWQEFNKAMLIFYHKNCSVRTDDVDYGAINQPMMFA